MQDPKPGGRRASLFRHAVYTLHQPTQLMPFAYYARLSPARQRIYRESDAIQSLEPPPGVATGAHVARLRTSLAAASRPDVQRACQALIDALVAGYGVQKIRVRVLAQRPADEEGELHGLYEPDDAPKPAHITVWMRTAARKDVVAFKTFLRTLIHELCHHLDYELYNMSETFHTEGFYKRESTLTNALLRAESTAAGLPG